MWKLSIALVVALGAHTVALAQSQPRSTVEVRQPWARATPGASTTGAAFITLIARGDAPDRLVAANSPVARAIEVHAHSEDHGIMHMHQLSGIDVPAGRATVFAPGGMHLMLIDLTQRLIEGQTFPLTLTFEHAGTVDVTVTVEKAGAKGPSTEAR